MNSSHYTSLEFSKKLYSIGMRGNGEYGYAEWQGINGVGDEHTKTEFTSKESFYNLGKRREEGGKWASLSWIFIEAYSVMEMLDVIPGWIETEDGICRLILRKERGWENGYYDKNGSAMIFNDTLPNAIAEMILWLVENGYINFNAS